MSFHDISQTTTRCATPFGFLDEERKRILETVQTTSYLTTSQPEQQKNLQKQFEATSRKELNLTLHLSTLTEYVKAARIPRGLRISLEPILCKNNKDFRDKWHQILDKCSLDLMTLTLQALQNEIQITTQEIHKIKCEIKTELTGEALTEYLNKVQVDLAILGESTIQRKLQKFRRDTLDYERDQVYTWAQLRRETRRGPGSGRHQPRDRRREVTSSAGSSDWRRGDTSDSSVEADSRSTRPAENRSVFPQVTSAPEGGGGAKGKKKQPACVEDSRGASNNSTQRDREYPLRTRR
ncbi:uncharacterized protein LOC121400545 [Xenopus laevis]|uniref:Uncharacterized protein LOC121400545 n=1 Tax=Xenopus laevis TaxID=8355 RepID=A0A8J1MDL7_XENLA|nr:uncharacterized protein LOC121400545 [Xenopus laevis]